jgi:RNA 2',3'-cyclic 3'-phosphodiesterase
VRLFFAAIPDRETRGLFADAARTALESLQEGFSRRVPQENYHVTAAFIGETDETRLATLRAIGSASACAARWSVPVSVRFDAYEYWTEAEAIVATASKCPPALEELSLAIRGDLLRQSLAPDPKPFRPHVTLARKVSQAPVFKAMSEIVWTLREFHLVRSERSARGSVYTVVDTWQLLDTASNHL